jgi:hypothetical protein
MNEWSADLAYTELLKRREIVDIKGQDINEATTRLRVIDTIIFDFLSWDKAEVDAEKYCRTEGYAEYVFFHERKPCLVLEAKREGVHFLLPSVSYRDTCKYQNWKFKRYFGVDD